MFDYLIDEKKLTDLFCELTSIDSVSLNERQFADVLKDKLTKLGIEAYEDNAGEILGGTAGNLYGYLDGNINGSPLLFSAHMDTVEPGTDKRAIIKSGRIVSESDTVLGADDAGGIAVILEAVRILKENKIPHRSIEVFFPVAEEIYAKGSSVFDYTKLRSKEGYVLDLTGKIGTASLREPTLISFSVEIEGKSAHAGFAPEEGINAITIFADAVHEIKQGRIDEETTVNIGTVNGGTVTNAIPQKVVAKGEIRSYVHEKALLQIEIIKNKFKAAALKYGGKAEVKEEINLVAYKVDSDEKVVKRFEKVCEGLNISTKLVETFGGSDNNSFLRNKIKGIVLSSAMEDVHTVNEYCDIEELKKSLLVVLNLMTSNI